MRLQYIHPLTYSYTAIIPKSINTIQYQSISINIIQCEYHYQYDYHGIICWAYEIL